MKDFIGGFVEGVISFFSDLRSLGENVGEFTSFMFLVITGSVFLLGITYIISVIFLFIIK